MIAMEKISLENSLSLPKKRRKYFTQLWRQWSRYSKSKSF